MSVAEIIFEKVQHMPKIKQIEILHFVEFMNVKKSKHPDSNKDLSNLSLSLAMQGMENDQMPDYSIKDIKEKF